jgi:hypothetical protein
MKKALLLATAIGLAAALSVRPAGAVDTIISIPQRVATYAASVVAMTPAASATDFFTITGSATKTVRVKRVSCTGASTADGSAVVQGIRRTTADTAGTSTTPTIVKYDANDAAATAVVRAYTANPTVGSTTNGGLTRIGKLATAVLATSAAGVPLVWDFGQMNDKEIVLRGVNDVFALNNGGVSFVAGAALSCEVVWTEN